MKQQSYTVVVALLGIAVGILATLLYYGWLVPPYSTNAYPQQPQPLITPAYVQPVQQPVVVQPLGQQQQTQAPAVVAPPPQPLPTLLPLPMPTPVPTPIPLPTAAQGVISDNVAAIDKPTDQSLAVTTYMTDTSGQRWYGVGSLSAMAGSQETAQSCYDKYMAGGQATVPSGCALQWEWSK